MRTATNHQPETTDQHAVDPDLAAAFLYPHPQINGVEIWLLLRRKGFSHNDIAAALEGVEFALIRGYP
jgi:hypothetical protein